MGHDIVYTSLCVFWVGGMGGRAILSQAISYQKFDNGVNEVLSCWLGINLMVSFQDITQNMFCNLAKTSHTVACTD